MPSNPARRGADPRSIALGMLVLYLVWGSTYLAIAVAVETIPPFLMAGARFVLAGVVLLGWTGSRMLARSLTNPVRRLHSATAKMGSQVDTAGITALLSPGYRSKDELGALERAFLHMAQQIGEHVNELEVLSTIGHDINTIGPDGLEGVLRKITDRAVELVQADACLVFLRDERMGCWVVEAASGEWNERLKKSVMLWEELPVCVQAFETRVSAAGDQFHSDERPQVLRRNLLGESMLAIPLLAIPLRGSSYNAEAARRAAEQSVGQALREAMSHRSYTLLVSGFFVCGFQVAFITAHFPAYIGDLGIDARYAVIALALIGFFNIIGSLSAGVIASSRRAPRACA